MIFYFYNSFFFFFFFGGGGGGGAGGGGDQIHLLMTFGVFTLYYLYRIQSICKYFEFVSLHVHK